MEPKENFNNANQEKLTTADFIRVRTEYYLKANKPSILGDEKDSLIPWNRSTIILDHGKGFLKEIPKYKDFCCIPNHTNYKQDIDGYYNIYSELPYSAVGENYSIEELENKTQQTQAFLKHIFDEQLEIGLDYLSLLFLHPTQILPILCLVSTERQTGKSTFLKWLKEIYGRNLTYINGQSFNSQFNSDWVEKLLIVMDEIFSDKKGITEKLKFLSTTNRDKIEGKGKDRIETDFFGKFILCSNNEDDFIQIDKEEVRFWIRKINSIESINTELLRLLIKEIPAFLAYIQKRPITKPKTSRMWFDSEDLKTDAWRKLVWKSNNQLENQMIELFYEYFNTYENEVIKVVPKDVANLIEKMFKVKKWTWNDIRKVLKTQWELIPESNALSYERVSLDLANDFYFETTSGRYYTITRNFIREKFVELSN